MPCASSPDAAPNDGDDAPRRGLSPAVRRRLPLTVCALLVAALLGVAASCPLPFAIAQPGMTADVLGETDGKPVISVAAPGGDRDTPAGDGSGAGSGKLLLTTIAATPPRTTVRAVDVMKGWLARDRAVLPHDVVYPVGDSTEEIRDYNRSTMKESQDAAVEAALSYLDLSPEDVTVELELGDIGGPSAGLLFALGIVERLGDDGRGADLTGGQVIAGTGTISPGGRVGPVGGVPLKTKAAKRDGATAFLLPKEECADAKAVRPEGLRLVPVTTLSDAVDALRALQRGVGIPRC